MLHGIGVKWMSNHVVSSRFGNTNLPLHVSAGATEFKRVVEYSAHEHKGDFNDGVGFSVQVVRVTSGVE